MASVTNVCINHLDFTLVSLALLSLVRFAAVSMSVGHFSYFVESCSLKTAMSCSNEFVKFVCFCVVHKVFVYCCITSAKGSVGVGGGGGWSAIERFCNLHSIWSKLSAGCPSPTHWHVIYLPHEWNQFIVIVVYSVFWLTFCLWFS